MPAQPDGRDVFDFGPFRLLAEDATLWRDGRRVSLPPRAGDILLVLVRRAGQLVTHHELLALWQLSTVDSAHLAYQIHVIRQALRDGFSGETVENVRKRGYRFLPEVTVRPTTPQAAAAIAESAPNADQVAVGHARLELSPVELATDAAVVVTEPAPLPQDATPSWRWTRFLWVVVAAVSALACIALLMPKGLPPLDVGDMHPLTDDGIAKGDSLFIDDNRLYYAGMMDQTALYAIGQDGGQPALVNKPPGMRIVDVSRTGTEFLAIRDPHGVPPELWALGGRYGSGRRIGQLTCDTATWSPDGHRIACASSEFLAVANADGSDLRNTCAVERLPTTLVAGRHSAQIHGTNAVNRAPSRLSLWEMRVDGTGLRPLFADGSGTPGRDRCCGEWTPDSEHFLFELVQNGESQLWSLTESTGAVTRLSMGGLSYHGPRVSTDGEKLFAVGVSPLGELVRYDQSSRSFSLYPPGISGTWLSFSPDRQSVVYVGHPDKKLWRARVDGSEKHQLLSDPFEVDGSVWSPDGNWIAFLSRMHGQQLRIHLVPAAGGKAVAIAGDGWAQGIPSWSPDSRRLIFGDVPIRYGQPQGGEVLRVYDVTEKTFAVVPASDGLWSPRWSPDGRYVAAVRIKDRTLQLLDQRTQRWQPWPAAEHIDNLSWSTDSRFLYYHTEGKAYLLRRFNIERHVVEDVASLNHMPLAAYWWSGLAPDNSPIVLRRRGGTEVYSMTLDRRAR